MNTTNKILFLLILLIAASFFTAGHKGARANEPIVSTSTSISHDGEIAHSPYVPDGYTLAWSDEFTGTVLDATKWSHRYEGILRGQGWLSAKSISVENGILSLTTKKIDGQLVTGMITTQGKFAPTYGYIESRIRFQKMQGHHGSFWLQTDEQKNFPGSPAQGGAEIDVVEFFGSGRSDRGTGVNLYWVDEAKQKAHEGSNQLNLDLVLGPQTKADKGTKQPTKPVELCDDFHVFAVEWTSQRYRFFIDGHLMMESNKGVSQRDEYLILSLLCHDWEAPKLKHDQLPDGMQVDYVRVYQLDSQTRITPVSSTIVRDSSLIKPNIVMIVADDQGWGDVGFHGSEIKTPNLDQLASNGTELTQFYAQPTCTSSRTALMTGRYPFRMGMHRQVIRPWHTKGLPLDERLLPEVLRDTGYETAICGKWHLGTAAKGYWPMSRGFDHQYGHLGGHLEYFDHTYYNALDWHRDQKPIQENGYSTDLIADESVRLIKQHDVSKPLFLYVAFNAPHAPLQVPEKYKKQYSDFSDPNRRTYAAMTTCMDEGIGRILAAIKRSKMRDNTLVIFFSDNGGATNNFASNLPLRGHKGEAYEGGIRVPAIVSWPGKVKTGAKVPGMLHVVDLFPTLVNLAGGTLESQLPLDGKDAWQTITENKPTPHEELVFNAGGFADAIRSEDWKLVYSQPAPNEPYRYELFNIADDPNETTDQSIAEAPIYNELKQKLNEYQQAAVKPDGLTPQAQPADWSAPQVWDFSE